MAPSVRVPCGWAVQAVSLMRQITEVEWLAMFTKADHMRAPINAACTEFGLHTAQRITAALAQWAHESQDFLKAEENLAYRNPERLMAVYPFRVKTLADAKALVAAGPEAIANRVYSNRMGNGPEASGDGWRYRGRGIVQLTGRFNYAAAEKALGVALVEFPDHARGPETGARIAGWHWKATGCNELADHDQFDAICDVINIGHATPRVGDSNGYQDRVSRWLRYREAMGLEVAGLP